MIVASSAQAAHRPVAPRARWPGARGPGAAFRALKECGCASQHHGSLLWPRRIQGYGPKNPCTLPSDVVIPRTKCAVVLKAVKDGKSFVGARAIPDRSCARRLLDRIGSGQETGGQVEQGNSGAGVNSLGPRPRETIQGVSSEAVEVNAPPNLSALCQAHHATQHSLCTGCSNATRALAGPTFTAKLPSPRSSCSYPRSTTAQIQASRRTLDRALGQS